MARPYLSEIDSWSNHETRVLEVFILALALLRKESNLPVQEVDINRKLWFCIHHANRMMSKKNKGLLVPPNYDSKNAPDADDEERAKREHKSPDFSCGFYDHQEVKPEKSAKFYVIECKRLGFPSGKWILNKNYVVYGICRFVEPECGYGKSVSSSAMIGYVQSMELEDILAEVNKVIEQNMLPAIGLSAGGWEVGGVSQLEQSLNRLRIPPGRFRLRHIWVDLRGKESQN